MKKLARNTVTFLVVMIAFGGVTATTGCGSKKPKEDAKNSKLTLEQLARIEWDKEFESAVHPEFLAQFKAANGKGVTSRGWKPGGQAAAITEAPKPPVVAPPTSPIAPPVVAPSTGPAPADPQTAAVITKVAGTTVMLAGQRRAVSSLNYLEAQQVLYALAQAAWNESFEGAVPPMEAGYPERFMANHLANTKVAVPIAVGPPAQPPAVAMNVPRTTTAPIAQDNQSASRDGRPRYNDSLDKRLEVPSDEAITEAAVLIKKLFGDEYEAAKKPDARTKVKSTAGQRMVVSHVANKLRFFGRKMFVESQKPGLDVAAHYKLMRIACDIAVQTGDIEAAFFITDKITAQYRVDRPEAFLEIMDKMSHTLRTPQDAAIYLQRTIAVNYSFIQADDFVNSNKVLLNAHNVAKRLGRRDLLLQIANAREDVIEQKKITAEYAEHALRLFQAPEDPTANAGLGKYLCFFKFRWNQGLTMLSQGNDETLRNLARDEQEGKDSPAKLADVADRWWDYSEKVKVPLHQIQIRLHAADLYTTALPKMENSLSRSLAEKRVAMVRKIPRSTLYEMPTAMPPPLPESTEAEKLTEEPSTAVASGEK